MLLIPNPKIVLIFTATSHSRERYGIITSRNKRETFAQRKPSTIEKTTPYGAVFSLYVLLFFTTLALITRSPYS